MHRAAIAVLVAFALVPVAAAATAPPKITVNGKISALSRSSITVDGARKVTCSVVSIAPRSLGFRVGSAARMVCVKGIVTELSRKSTSSVTVEVSSSGSSSSTETSTSSEGGSGSLTVTAATGGPTTISATVTGGTLRVSGKGAIAAMSKGTLRFGNSVTCSLGGDSPDVSGYKVGDRVSFRCTATAPTNRSGYASTAFDLLKDAGKLTSIERAS